MCPSRRKCCAITTARSRGTKARQLLLKDLLVGGSALIGALSMSDLIGLYAHPVRSRVKIPVSCAHRACFCNALAAPQPVPRALHMLTVSPRQNKKNPVPTHMGRNLVSRISAVARNRLIDLVLISVL
jgi:hypothetical protein